MIQNVEIRLRKVEEVSQNICKNLSVIHRFMATRINDANQSSSDAPSDGNAERKTSERSAQSFLGVKSRRKPTRSLTEVIPGKCIFDEEETDDAVQSEEVIRLFNLLSPPGKYLHD